MNYQISPGSKNEPGRCSKNEPVPGSKNEPMNKRSLNTISLEYPTSGYARNETNIKTNFNKNEIRLETRIIVL